MEVYELLTGLYSDSNGGTIQSVYYLRENGEPSKVWVWRDKDDKLLDWDYLKKDLFKNNNLVEVLV